jgi:hypothetical protein
MKNPDGLLKAAYVMKPGSSIWQEFQAKLKSE